jgi:hypothetical protein
MSGGGSFGKAFLLWSLLWSLSVRLSLSRVILGSTNAHTTPFRQVVAVG